MKHGVSSSLSNRLPKLPAGLCYTRSPTMTESKIAEVKLSIDSEFENIELVQAVLEDSLSRLALDDDSRYWIGIAVREAVANAIKHGNQQDSTKKVTVDLTVVDELLKIQISDEGEGFDPTEVADPLNPENLLKPSGRGIFYMKRFMDDIQYSFGPSGGTMVTLLKKLGGDQEPSEENAGGTQE